MSIKIAIAKYSSLFILINCEPMLTLPQQDMRRPQNLFVGFACNRSLAWLFWKQMKAVIQSISHMNIPQDFCML